MEEEASEAWNVKEFDEDVVYENSPLYQYLQQIGHVDFESCPLASSTTHQVSEPMISQPIGYWESFKIVSLKMKEKFYGFYGNKSKHNLEQEVNCEYLIDYTNLLCASNLLTPNDREYLETYGTSLFNINTTNTTNKKYISILPATIVLLACLVGISKQVDTESNPGILLVILFLVSLLVLYLITQTIRVAKQNRLKQLHTGNIDKLKSFLQQSEMFINILKKSIRLVKESELIARGFFMVTPKTPITRLEHSRHQGLQRQCPALRQVIFNSARNLILSLRQATCTLLEKFPLSSEVDNIGNYVCSIPLEEMGLCFTSSQKDTSRVDCDRAHSDDDVMRQATDDHSITALKTMSNLLSDQGSEFIRRLTMCFCMEAYEDVKHWSENELYQSLDNILTISDAAMEDCLNLLQKSYNFHRIGILEKDDEKNVRFNRKETALPGGDVLVAVHSLELHLQVALKRVRNCQEKIESLTDIDVIKAQGDTLSADLSQLQTDLDACKGCLDEGSVRLYRLLGKSSGQGQDTPTAKPTECNENEGNRKSEKEPIPLFGLPEPDIEFDDQIFEGYTDPIEIEGTEWDYEPMTVEEREQRKRQKEESVRMLSELRSVLAVRTTERERLKQEKQAKKQNQSHAVTDAKAPSLDSCFEDVDTLKLGESKMIVLDASEERLRGGKDISTDQEKCSSTAAWTSDDPLMQGMPSTENPHGMDGQSSIQCHSGDEVRSHLKTTGVTAAVMSLSQEECADTTDRQSERVYDELFSQDCSNCDDKEKNEDSDDKAPLLPSVVSRERLLAKLGQGQVFNITSSIAAQAARKSHNLNLQVQTFGDEFDDGEDFLEG